MRGFPDIGTEAINRWALTLAEEWWDGQPWETLTDQQRKDALREAESIVTSEAEHEYDRRIERTA